MEVVVRIRVEALPEGLYLATSDDVQGLVAQGRNIAAALEIARDVAKKLLEDRDGDQGFPALPNANGEGVFSVVVGA